MLLGWIATDFRLRDFPGTADQILIQPILELLTHYFIPLLQSVTPITALLPDFLYGLFSLRSNCSWLTFNRSWSCFLYVHRSSGFTNKVRMELTTGRASYEQVRPGSITAIRPYLTFPWELVPSCELLVQSWEKAFWFEGSSLASFRSCSVISPYSLVVGCSSTP